MASSKRLDSDEDSISTLCSTANQYLVQKDNRHTLAPIGNSTGKGKDESNQKANQNSTEKGADNSTGTQRSRPIISVCTAIFRRVAALISLPTFVKILTIIQNRC